MLEFQQEKFNNSFMVWDRISLKGLMPVQALIFMVEDGDSDLSNLIIIILFLFKMNIEPKEFWIMSSRMKLVLSLVVF